MPSRARPIEAYVSGPCPRSRAALPREAMEAAVYRKIPPLIIEDQACHGSDVKKATLWFVPRRFGVFLSSLSWVMFMHVAPAGGSYHLAAHVPCSTLCCHVRCSAAREEWLLRPACVLTLCHGHSCRYKNDMSAEAYININWRRGGYRAGLFRIWCDEERGGVWPRNA